MSIFDDVKELLDPAGVGYKTMSSRSGAAAPVYPGSITGTLAPAYVLRKPRRILNSQGDEVQVSGECYAPAAPLLDQTALLVLADGDRKIVSAYVPQENDVAPGQPAFQVIYFQ